MATIRKDLTKFFTFFELLYQKKMALLDLNA
jgi:hypothetical protein